MAGRILNLRPLNDTATIQGLVDDDLLTEGRFKLVAEAERAGGGDLAVQFAFQLERGIYKIRLLEAISGEKNFGPSDFRIKLEPKATVATIALGGSFQPGHSTGVFDGGKSFAGHYDIYPPIKDANNLRSGFDKFDVKSNAELEIKVANSVENAIMFCDCLVHLEARITTRIPRFPGGGGGTSTSVLRKDKSERCIVKLDEGGAKRAIWSITASDRFEGGHMSIESVG